MWRPKTSFLVGAGNGAAELFFLFAPNCARSVAGQCKQIFPLFFSVGSLTRFVARANIVGVLNCSLTRQCSCCSFVTQWSGINPLLAEVVVHGK